MAEFVAHEECPSCGSSDNLARYSDGSASCFSPGCKHYERADKSYVPPEDTGRKPAPLLMGEVQALSSRRLTEETCKKFSYKVSTFYGEPVQVASYRNDDGQIVAQKIRTRNKDFRWLGKKSEVSQLFGQHLWRDQGRRVVITEGEIDCMSVSQIQNNKYPVVSIPDGAGAVKSIKASSTWLEGFDEVVFCFDGDDAGRDGAIECAAQLSPGKAKIAYLPEGEDPNSLVLSGKADVVTDAIWGAKSYRPDGILSLSDLRDKVMEEPEKGLPWPWETLTEHTYGIRRGEVYVYGAGVGIGKTTAFLQVAEHMVSELQKPVGLFYYEQPVVETAKRISGMRAGKQFHIPNPEHGEPIWTAEELIEAFEPLEPYVFLYDHFGSISWEETKKHIRYLAKAHGVRDFFVDHLTALVAHAKDERRELDSLMAEVASLAQELQITVHLISHLTTPDGKPHEEGGRVFEKHFTGSRAIARWAHFMFALERNKQAEDIEERQTTTFRVLKDRFTGRASGRYFHIKYDQDTGKLIETDAPSGMFSDASGEPDF